MLQHIILDECKEGNCVWWVFLFQTINKLPIHIQTDHMNQQGLAVQRMIQQPYTTRLQFFLTDIKRNVLCSEKLVTLYKNYTGVKRKGVSYTKKFISKKAIY